MQTRAEPYAWDTSSGSLGTRVERRGNKAGDRMDVGWQNELPDVQIKQQNGSTHAADGGSLLPWGERVENQPLFVPCVETVRKSIGSLITQAKKGFLSFKFAASHTALRAGLGTRGDGFALFWVFGRRLSAVTT